MKKLLIDSIEIAALIFVCIHLFGCASRPDVWRDKYGIIHRENVSVNEVTFVKVISGRHQLPGTCIRLRNIYLDGTRFKDWELKHETAKMSGTHVIKEYYNGVSDTMGIAYDCNNHHQIRRNMQMQKRYLQDRLMGEAERRTYEKNKHKVVKDSIPQLDI